MEVGAWQGRSAAFMAVEIVNSGKQIQFDIVDHWLGSEEHHNPGNTFHEPRLQDSDWLYEQFLRNLNPVIGSINPIRLESQIAAEQYEDNSLDFVFIDAAHDFDSVREDVGGWKSKVRSGGLLAGDDYLDDAVWSAISAELTGHSIQVWDSAWRVEL